MFERQDLWFRYDDVPNATEEELFVQYPRVLATFYQQARQSSTLGETPLWNQLSICCQSVPLRL